MAVLCMSCPRPSGVTGVSSGHLIIHTFHVFLSLPTYTQPELESSTWYDRLEDTDKVVPLEDTDQVDLKRLNLAFPGLSSSRGLWSCFCLSI